MRRVSIVPLAIGLALGCGGTTTDARRDVEPGGDASTGPVEWCTGAVALSNSSQGNAFCIVKADESLWCWGNGGCGQLGTPDAPFTTAPIAVTLQGLGARFASVSVGWGTNSCWRRFRGW